VGEEMAAPGFTAIHHVSLTVTAIGQGSSPGVVDKSNKSRSRVLYVARQHRPTIKLS
jgi:hypothetical protein